MTITLERFPKTVSACHAEIIKLRKAIGDVDNNAERIAALETERDELKGQLEEEEAENEELAKRVEELEEKEQPDAIAAIDRFLYEVERPVGQLKFDVAHGPAADRAILGLYDAVGRQP